ncbi:MAG: 2-hydroxyacyl-CoA dehydratase [Deltaproteobacteria bacterium]|nr:2-hydroxyacyl-CoA dehydratase [Deltaproteobacteria bacterium]
MNIKAAQQACSRLELAQLDALAAIPGRAPAMQPFDALFRKGAGRVDKDGDPRPRVGQLCNFLPEELILAAGCVPLRLDNAYPLAPESEADGLPVDLCCAVKTAAALIPQPPRPPGVPGLPGVSGMQEGTTGRSATEANACLPEVDLLVIPNACDGKRKLVNWMQRRGDKPRVLSLELPPRKRGDDVSRWWREQMERLIQEMERLSGKRIKRTALADSVALLQRRTRALRALNELRTRAHPPLHGADAFLVMLASFRADPLWWCEQVEALVRELANRNDADLPVKPRARLLLTGAPILWPDFSLLTAVLDAGADVVADETCSGTNRLHHPVVVDEQTKNGLIRASAERTLLPCTCPCFAENEDRLERIALLSRQYEVQGVLHHNLRLCAGFDIDSLAIAAQVKKQGLGWLALHTEFQNSSLEGLGNRLQAFIETIE